MKKYLLVLSIWGLGGAGLVIWKDWNQLAALATWFLVLGVVFAFLQIQQARKSTNAQIAVELFKELREDKALEKLRSIYRLRPNQTSEQLSNSENHIIDYVLDRLDLLGALVNREIIDNTLAMEGFGGPTIIRCWFQLAHYIRNNQKERGFYVENYEDLTNKCLKYFDDECIKVSFDNPHITKIENLVKELRGWEDDESKKELYPRSLEKIKEARRKNKSKQEANPSGEV